MKRIRFILFIKKLRAFTLMEIIMSLILSMFVLAILYLTYSLLQNQINKNNADELSMILILKNSIEYDLFNSQEITESDNTILFSQNNYRVNYHLKPSVILKEKDNLNDTLFKGKYSTLLQKDQQDRIVNIEIEIISEDSTKQSLLFMKEYFPNQLLMTKEISFEY